MEEAVRYHSQNLNERHGRYGSVVRHGRAWWTFGSRSIHPDGWLSFRLEWSFFRRNSWAIGIDLADYDEDAVGGNLALGPLLSVHWGIGQPTLRHWMERITSREAKPRELDQCAICRLPKAKCNPQGWPDHVAGHKFKPRTYWSTNGRTMGIRLFDSTCWLDFWNDPMEWNHDDPWWWHISIHPVDIIFGRTKYEEKTLTTERVIVPMPEGPYPATVRIHEDAWRRPRWPWVWKRMVRSDIVPDEPIPFPGKGESEYDCGEDATHSSTSSGETALDAVLYLVESVMQRRIRYGSGWRYVPENLRQKLAGQGGAGQG
jgi:hypothetical protein